MKNNHSFCRLRSRTRGQIVSLIKRLLFGESVFPLLITTAQFAMYWMALGAMMTSTGHHIEDRQSFTFDEILSLLDGYALSSQIQPELVVLGNLLTSQEE